MALSVLMAILVRSVISLNPTPLILLAVGACAWYGGMVPGIISALLWTGLADMFIGPEPIVLRIRIDGADLPRFLVLMAIAILAARLRAASEARKARARQQEAIAQLGQRALAGTELSTLISEIAPLIVETLDVTHCAIFELITEENALVVRAGAGWKQGVIGELKLAGGADSMPGYIINSGEPLITSDIRSEKRFRVHPVLTEHKIISALNVIIHGQGSPFGVLGIYSTRKAKLTSDDINFAQAIANVLSMAIERKRGEEHLENQQRWLEGVFDLMPVAAVFIEPGTAKVTFANRAANEIAGGEFPKGKPAGEYHTAYYCTDSEGKRIPDDRMPGVQAARGERLDGSQLDWHTPKGKRSIIVSSDTIPAMHGHPATVVLAFQDITELKRIEDQLQRANQLKDEFLATVSHELRTPLNAMLGWARMLRGGSLDEPTAARALEIIERNARFQAQIIEDLLDVSSIITGKLRLDVAAVELGAVIESAIDAVQPALDAKGIRLQVVLDPRAGSVLGDDGRLQQIVWNLLSNAAKFTPRNGRVQVSLERVNSQVEITVSDTGQGISPEFLPFVFDRFRQQDSTMTREHSGLGLGLAIVRHLVEMHGGAVSAYSEGEGKGATFKVKLPIMIAQESGRYRTHSGRLEMPAIESQMVFEPSSALSGVRLLVVDDDPDARELLASILKQSGAELVTADSATQAIACYNTIKPDVLISDIEMPGEDGYSLIRKIRKIESEQGGWMPAIALTAHARAEDRVRALAAGYQSHVAKPVEPAELVATISSLTRRPFADGAKE
jgi:signal transduction histidine kinase/CheY-like chemotaxis protein